MQFVDRVNIVVESGAGGDGMVAWRREKFVPNGGPAGGDGGDGGSVIIEATQNMHTLLDFKYASRFNAEPGGKGQSKNCHGKSAPDKVIQVPCGTVVMDAETDQPIGDLVHPGDQVMVAVGGRGGRGNSRFSSSRRQAPQFAEPGEPGITRQLWLELKLIADVGLLGLPNAGKSTFIAATSAARPKIADYPFTTLTPNLGVVKRPAGDGVVIADIPGLIEGASEGVGLGHAFLRHVERTRLLLHLVDMTSLSEDPVQAYQTIQNELAKYSPRLAAKPQLLVLTKADATDPDTVASVKAAFQNLTTDPLFVISAVSGQGLEDLLVAMFTALDALPADVPIIDVLPDAKAYANDDSAFELSHEGNSIVVRGGKVDRLIRVTDFMNPPAVRRMLNIFNAMGIQKALTAFGVEPGQTIILGGIEFEYHPDEGL